MGSVPGFVSGNHQAVATGRLGLSELCQHRVYSFEGLVDLLSNLLRKSDNIRNLDGIRGYDQIFI